MAASFAGGGGACIAAAAVGGGAWSALLWPALVCLAVAAGYLGVGPRVLGKRRDGTRPAFMHVLMLPYLGVAWLVWRLLRRRKRIEPYDRVAPGVLVARRLYPHELPPGVALVVDMTAEFDEPRGIREAAPYLAVPVLDGAVPSEADYLELVDRLAAVEGDVLVHCAAGHGRSATVAGGVLLRRGVARTVDEAVSMLERARPTVDLEPHQRAMLGFVLERASPRERQVA
jgi:hypothetical protein